MGRRKKGDSVEAITQQISKIVIGSGHVLTSLRVSSANTHRVFYERSQDESKVNLVEESAKLFCSPSSEVIIAGSPSASSVVNSFEAASVHSEMGRMLKIFASAVVDLFVKGPDCVIDFTEKWLHMMQSAPQKYHFELQGLNPLFSFIFFQVVQARKKYLNVLKKACLPDTVEGVDNLIQILQELREALAAPPPEEEVAAPSESITEPSQPVRVHSPKPPVQEVPAPAPAAPVAASPVKRAPRRQLRPLSPVKPNSPRRVLATTNVQPTLDTTGERSHPDEVPHRRQSLNKKPALQLHSMQQAVEEGNLPLAALSTGALLAKGLPLPGNTVAELRPITFAPQFPSQKRNPAHQEAELSRDLIVTSKGGAVPSAFSSTSSVVPPMVTTNHSIPSSSSARGWREFWDEEEKKKLQEKYNFQNVTNYSARDLARYSEEMNRLRSEVLGHSEESVPSNV